MGAMIVGHIPMSAMYSVKSTVREGVKFCSTQNNTSLKRTPDQCDCGIYEHMNAYNRIL